MKSFEYAAPAAFAKPTALLAPRGARPKSWPAGPTL